MSDKIIKPAIHIVLLVAIEQFIKILISTYCMGVDVALIPNVIHFQPIQNLNLNWIFSMAAYTPLPIAVIIIDIVAFLFILLSYKYTVFYYGSYSWFFSAFRTLGCAGALCALIDVAAWGGSIDYISLLDWFVFDLKDVYIITSGVFLVLGMIKKQGSVSNVERAERDIIVWIKKGFPKTLD